jgi:hypothetical protein
MRRRTLVYFVCSPHSRTGVTTAARLLTDYYLSRGVAVQGFDTDSGEPCYAALFPDLSRVVDVCDIRGQISLFDRLLVPDDTPKVVDIWSRSFDRFYSVIAEIGFLEEARRAGVEPIVLYQADASRTAANNAQMLNVAWPDLRITLVHNEGAAPLGDEAYQILSAYPTRGRFVIGKLDAPVAKFLDVENLSLSALLKEPPAGMSIVVRAALRAWMLPIFTQFQSFELRLDLQSSQFLR